MADNRVDGENTGEVMNPGYNDANAPTNGGGDIIDGADGNNDTILGNGGNDTINAGLGEDRVSGGSGEDSIDGGEGDDLIYGDINDSIVGDRGANGGRESFNWRSAAKSGNTYTQNTGEVQVTFTATDPASYQAKVSGDAINTSGIESANESINNNSSFLSWQKGSSQASAYNLSFSDEVGNVSFNISDIDQGSDVVIRAYDENGNRINVDLQSLGAVSVSGDKVTGIEHNVYATSSKATVNVSIDGPVARVEIDHLQDGGVYISDVFFDNTAGSIVVDDGANNGPFDDVIDGGAGNDIIYGDNGDSISAGGTNGAGGVTLSDQLNSDEYVPGPLYGRYPSDGVLHDRFYDFSTDAFYLGDDIPLIDDSNYRILNGRSFSQDGSGNSSVTELVNVDFSNTYKSNVGLIQVHELDSWAAEDKDDRMSASNGNGLEGIASVHDVNVKFTMNDGTVFSLVRMEMARSESGKTYLFADDHPRDAIFRSIRSTVMENDSGIKSFKIEHVDSGKHAMHPIEGNWAAGQFYDVIDPIDGEGGDDIITGGEGADTMFGEGGNDTFIVGSATEGAGDKVVGGNGPDQNTDKDVLDLRGAGVVTINDQADETDAGARKGTVTFENGSTLEFSQIEEILQDVAPTKITCTPVPGTPVDDEGRPITAENGAPAQIVVSLDAPALEDTEITLTNGDPSEINPPLTVTILAGQTSVVVEVPSVDDTDVDGTQIAPITATAPGLTGDTIEVAVLDDDVPTLIITPAPNTTVDVNGNPVTQENGDPTGIVITRTGPLDAPLEVTLTSDDTTEATVRPSVTIPAGQDSVFVQIDPVDDPLVDGTQFPTITATAEGFDPVTQNVAVLDDDVAPTKITITPAPGAPVDDEGRPVTTENGAPAQIVVSLDAPALEDTEITLTDLDPSETDAPATVTILAGETSVIVVVPSVDDPDVDGTQIAPITATAPGLTGDTIEVAVLDDDIANRAPVAKDDVFEGPFVEGEPIAIDVAAVLSNDSDPDGDPIRPNAVISTVGGSFAMVNNVPTFIPDAGFVGDAKLTYQITDDKGGVDTATITFKIVADANQDPIAKDDDLGKFEADTPAAIDVAKILSNDIDPDGDALSATAVVATENGQFAFINGVPSFVPDAGFTGTASLTYKVEDGKGGSDTATIYFEFVKNDPNQAPTANDDTIDGASDADKVVIDPAVLLANDTDPNPGDVLTLKSVGNPVNGSVSIDPTTGNVIFSPTAGYCGPASFTYVIADQAGLTSEATVNLSIAVENSINGTRDDDVIEGTNGSDGIHGLEGNDTINGNDGDDCIDGGHGDDVIEGGNGDDMIKGNAGNDKIDGNAGNDMIDGNAGNDFICGGDGDDKLLGGAGDDVVGGENGNDRVQGGQGNDSLWGDAGADTFIWTYNDIQPFGNGREIDTIKDMTSEDKLDLADLLQNEQNSDNLDSYLDFEFDAATGDTTIAVSALGSFDKADDSDDCQYKADQLIILEGVDITAGNTIADEYIIQNMLNNNQLIID